MNLIDPWKGHATPPVAWRVRNVEGLGEGLMGASLDIPRRGLSPPQSIFDSLSYSVAPLSPPKTEYDRDAEIGIRELGPLGESFRGLNQRLQKMGYRFIKGRYGWYWRKTV